MEKWKTTSETKDFVVESFMANVLDEMARMADYLQYLSNVVAPALKNATAACKRFAKKLEPVKGPHAPAKEY
jgi:hypothetical protein